MIRSAAVALAFIAIAACLRGTTTFVVINDGKDAIRSAVVDVSGTAVELGRIAPGQEATGEVAVRGDGEYHVTIRFESGGVLDRRLGYVTSGVVMRGELSVSENDIVLKNVGVK